VSEQAVRRHLGSLGDALDAGIMPPHYPTCLGCGPEAEQGFHLQVRREGNEMVTEHVFEPRHSGGPGVAHGGTVATVVDDLLGFLLYVERVPGVTRTLTVDYLTPVRVGVPYVVRGRLDRRDGRKLWVSCSGTGPDGLEAFRATGLFLVVGLEHFGAASSSAAGQEPIAP